MMLYRFWLFFITGLTITQAVNLEKVLDDTKCTTEIDGKNTTISVGETWYSADPCIKFTCKIDPTGKTQPDQIKEECRQSCRRGYELQPVPGKCCGLCVKTKCFYLNKIYSIGDTWHNKDRCMLFECVLQNSSPVISTFKKTCPDISDCLAEDIYTKDCCPTCRDGKSLKVDPKSHLSSYDRHPCRRKCIASGAPMICEYKFEVEWYETLSKACYNCPLNDTDCFRPQCVTGDGARKSILVVNRIMPGPSIEVCLNDTIVVDVSNGMFADSTSIHWHGLHQKKTPYMDGVPNLTQCPISPYTTFRYKFQAHNPGTHFWHSHVGLQRGDGCFGALIIRQPDDLHSKLYDFDLSEHIILKQDWIHTNSMSMFTKHHHSIGNNKPVNILVNGKGRYLNTTKVVTDPIEEATTEPEDIETTTYSENDIPPHVESPSMKIMELIAEPVLNITDRLNSVPLEIFNVAKGSRYRFRTINSGFLNCPIVISVDNHSMLVIHSDGFDLEPIEVNSLITYAGERFDFVLNANQAIGNYWIRFRGLMDCDERFGNVHQVAILHYNGAADQEPAGDTEYDYPLPGLQLNPLNKGPGQVDSLTIAEISALNDDEEWVSRKNPDYKFYIYYDFNSADHPLFYNPPLYGIQNVSTKTYSPQLNRISLKIPPVALLPARDQVDESTFCNETSLKKQGIDCEKVFCECHHVLKVALNSVVELVLVDEGHTFDANHPFHLHGHAFRVLGMDRVAKEVTVDQIKDMDNQGLLNRNLKRPPIKDTITVPDGGYSIVRFKADNPGFWLLHCHIDFHAEIGMALIFKVGENAQMLPVPKNFPTCSNYMPKITEFSSNKNGGQLRIVCRTLIITLALSLFMIYLF